ncbi:MAG: carbohydrate binding family 9 domain-containing protein [Gammaproteobacteria bacterium]|nr:carbohydrate binding family 9 domain-containing protein [Gammaproteobacteria bacterium]
MTNTIRHRPFFVLVYLLAVPVFAANEAGERKIFSITRTDSPPTVDGRLDDPAWLHATIVDDFHQQTPNYREDATEKTVVRLLYDDDYLYVGADLRDREPDKVVATQLIQGRNFNADDRFLIAIDSFNSKRNDYLFEVNPNGMRSEVLRETNSRFIADWVTIWEAESAMNEHGWATEIAIPFKSISFDPNLDLWGVNFARWIIRKQEFDLWSSNERLWWAADSGEMSGISGIQQGLGLDIIPSVNLIQSEDFNIDSDELTVEPSLDVLYKITPSLSATLTLNTDFSAAEVDQQQVALDRFSLFFPEKRDFFLQDAGIFEFGNLNANGRPFFSRRIGLSADGMPIDIDVGGKLTGRSGALSIGVLGVHQEAYKDVTAKDLFVGRVAANVLSESSVGVIVTSGDPTSNDSNTLVGTDFLYRNSDGPFGQIVLGQVWYQQSDSPGLNGENRAYGGVFQVPNDRLNVSLGAMEIQENFTPALGFVNRSGIRQLDSTIRYRTRPQTGRWREIDNQIQATLVTDITGKVLSRSTRIRPLSLLTQTGDLVFIEWQQNRERVLNEFPLFGRLPVPAADYEFDRYRIEFSSGTQRPISVVLAFEDGEFFGGNRRQTFVDFEWRQSAHFFLGLGFTENTVELPNGRFTSHLGRLRTDIAFNARWSWSNLIQYDNVAEVVGVSSRLRYEPVAGREMLLVLNHGSSIENDNNLFSTNQEIVLKASYTFRY